MDKIKEFISEFILKEFSCNKSEYDFSISDEEFNLLKKDLIKLHHSLTNDDSFSRAVSKEYAKYFDEDELKLYAKNSEKAIPRTLFQIKQYKDFELGDNLQRIVTENNLYACYLSYEPDNGMPLDYSDIFYVAETNEGLKIIYNMRYGVKNREWRHPHDLEVLQVINNGNLVAVEKYQAPEEATSLADYNNE